MNEIIDIIIKLAGTLLGVALIYLVKRLSGYLSVKLDAADQAKLETLISSLVAAAEQLYKAEDEDGSVRLGYVQGMLIEAGYDLTDAVRALIESKVYALNTAQEQHSVGGEDGDIYE